MEEVKEKRDLHDRVNIMLQKSGEFRRSKDEGLTMAEMMEVIKMSADKYDLVSSVYDIAYRRGYNRARKETLQKYDSVLKTYK